MHVVAEPLPGLLVLEPRVFGDARGYFFETYNARAWREASVDADFVQDNEAFSRRGVLRGLHYQRGEFAQAKLVRVMRGEVVDVAVDLRAGSPTYGQHHAVRLSGDNKLQFFVPRGFAHGYAVLSDEAVFAYKCDNFYAPASEGGLRWDDPQLAVDWGLSAGEVQVSEKDAVLPHLGRHADAGVAFAG